MREFREQLLQQNVSLYSIRLDYSSTERNDLDGSERSYDVNIRRQKQHQKDPFNVGILHWDDWIVIGWLQDKLENEEFNRNWIRITVHKTIAIHKCKNKMKAFCDSLYDDDCNVAGISVMLTSNLAWTWFNISLSSSDNWWKEYQPNTQCD